MQAADEGDRPSKRQRHAGGSPVGVEVPSGSAAAGASREAGCRLPDAPMHLLAVKSGIEGWANEGFLGCRLSDLVSRVPTATSLVHACCCF